MKRYLKILILFIIMFILGTVNSNAAITVNSKSINSGEQVVISVNSDIALGAYTVSVTDDGGLKFITSSGQEGSGKKIISGSSTSGVTNLATFTFQAPEVTENKVYNVKISAVGMETVNLESVNNSNATSSITVKAKEKEPEPSNQTPNNNDSTQNNSNNTSTNNTVTTNNNNNKEKQKSSNANLSNLIVEPVDFKGFKANKTEGYSVTVENDVTQVKIKATKQDENAKVEISGNNNLKVGENIVNVVVTAEDGTKKTYKVNVIRKEKKVEEITNTNQKNDSNTVETSAEVVEDKKEDKEIQNEENVGQEISTEEQVLGISSLNILGLTKNEATLEPNLVPNFNMNIYEYSCTVPFDVEKLKIDAVANAEGATIEVIGNEELIVGDNIIKILVKSPDNSNEQIYKIKVKKTRRNYYSRG